MSEKCAWLHKNLEMLPLIKYPFDLDNLPKNGIYFFYEKGEMFGHGWDIPRVVRIGTHKNDNFGKRIADHYLFDSKDMVFNKDAKKPSDRSIFRKNIGRVLLNRKQDPYLSTWNKDFTRVENRKLFSHLRDVAYEKRVEEQITQIIRNKFSFRYIIIEEESRRMGDKSLEKALIGTVSKCELCKPSSHWLGNALPKEKVRKSGLWQDHYLGSDGINEKDKSEIGIGIKKTQDWFSAK